MDEFNDFLKLALSVAIVLLLIKLAQWVGVM